MSLELGLSNTGHPLVKRIIPGYEGTIEPPPQFLKMQDTSDVFDGRDHIWPYVPVSHPTVTVSDVTSFQVRYLWGSSDGKDFDTSSFYLNSPDTNLNNKRVGWSQGNDNIIPYLYWGGDNTYSGAECVMFNIGEFEHKGMWEQMPEELTLVIGGRWYGSRNKGNVRLEITAYNQGVIVKSYQLGNQEDDIPSRGAYIYVEADGSVNLGSENKKYWYGEAVVINNSTICKINPIDDSIEDLPEEYRDKVKVQRISSSDYIYEDGYLKKGETRYKIWNNQYNDNGRIVSLPKPDILLNDSINTIVQYHKVMLDEHNVEVAKYRDKDVFQFGFCAGNADFKGQHTMTINVPDGSEIANPHLICKIYYGKDKTVRFVGEDPVKGHINDVNTV